MTRITLFPSRVLLVLLAALSAAVVLLSGALGWTALRPGPVVIVPGVRESQIMMPEEIPSAAVRKFAYLYLAFFDSYTPETIEDRSTYLLRLVAPEALERVGRDLLERATYVVRTRESSHLILPPPSASADDLERLPGGNLRLSIVAERRTYIASEEKARANIRYTLTLRPALPSDQDAFGFVVIGQTLRAEMDGPAAKELGGKRHD
jgi:TraE protein